MGARPRRTPSELQLILPGLVWPMGGLSASLAGLALPGLAELCGRGRIRHAAPQPWAQWLAHACAAAELPYGRLRAAGENLPPARNDGEILCVDPVSLRFTSDALLLRAPRELALSEAESAALVASLNEEFAHVGAWVAATPERWYLFARAPLQTRFHPLSDVQGRPVALFPPEGEGARDWNRLLNEIQISLTHHPVNRARSDRGELVANAIWPWGAGSLAALELPASALCSADPVMNGLAAHCHVPRLDPRQICAGRPGRLWWHDAGAHEAALTGDLNAWLGALLRIDRDIVQPALAAWRAGHITRIELVAPCDKTLFSVRLERFARYLPWRRALAPAALAALLQTPDKKSA